MPTPKFGYTVAGQKVPSVTTILNRFKKSEELIDWAHRLGLAGKSHHDERDAAMAVGTCVHSCIDLAVAGEPIPPSIAHDNKVRPTDIQLARNAYAAWCEWRDTNKPTFEETEVGLVSEQHLYGGTFDAICTIAGKRVLMDWKTSNRIYNDYYCQLFAYDILVTENGLPPADLVGVLRLDKNKRKYEEKIIETTGDKADKYRKAFLKLREAYEALKDAGALYNK